LLIPVLGIGAGLLTDEYYVAWLTRGMALGILVRDLGALRVALKLWPATRAIIDRERLDELLAEPPDDNYS
jgi:hypothetical protein